MWRKILNINIELPTFIIVPTCSNFQPLIIIFLACPGHVHVEPFG